MSEANFEQTETEITSKKRPSKILTVFDNVY
ncbi:hypothetical protein SAMN03097699_3318 [Flavobacteriaceae bacterium MAR_2010_188]|nr:hypothetical protein SAMN03097699_3318 [Flavobacteriaceae bacterium MAR_2010_188]